MTRWGTASRHKKSTNLAAPRVKRDGRRAWGKTHELFWNELLWRMNAEVQLLKDVQNLIYEDAEMSFDFDCTNGCNEMERDGAEKGSKQEF